LEIEVQTTFHIAAQDGLDILEDWEVESRGKLETIADTIKSKGIEVVILPLMKLVRF
jgi:hypothetical protein